MAFITDEYNTLLTLVTMRKDQITKSYPSQPFLKNNNIIKTKYPVLCVVGVGEKNYRQKLIHAQVCLHFHVAHQVTWAAPWAKSCYGHWAIEVLCIIFHWVITETSGFGDFIAAILKSVLTGKITFCTCTSWPAAASHCKKLSGPLLWLKCSS